MTKEHLSKRPPAVRDTLWVGESNHLSLLFLKKLWKIINSNQFASISWEVGGPCISIDEAVSKDLERDGPPKVFETNCMKSFIWQLYLYGFCKVHQDFQPPISIITFFTEDRPIWVLSKITRQTSPGTELLDFGERLSGQEESPEHPLGNWVPVIPFVVGEVVVMVIVTKHGNGQLSQNCANCIGRDLLEMTMTKMMIALTYLYGLFEGCLLSIS